MKLEIENTSIGHFDVGVWCLAIMKLTPGHILIKFVLFQFRFSLENRDSIDIDPARRSLSLLRGVHKISEVRKSTGPRGQLVNTATTTYLIGCGAKDPGKRSFINVLVKILV